MPWALKAMLAGLGIESKINRYTDSSAARGIIHRAGLGKLRHLETRIPLAASGSKSEEAACPEGSWDREPGRPRCKAPRCSRYVEALRNAADVGIGR